MSQVKSSFRKPSTSIVILISFILALIGCSSVLRSILWKNTNAMGLSLVKNYSSVEEENIKTCGLILNICSNYIAEFEQAEIPAAELREGLYPFMNGLTNIYGSENIRIYGVLKDGKTVVSNIPELEAMTEYDVRGMAWYQGAAAANGETYISPVYTEAATGLPVVTICRLIPETGSILAIDLRPSYFEMNRQDISVPEGSSYFLVDADGNLVNYLSSWDYEREEF